ncbi:hypothetical protein SKAU_G00417790 [Synaphobranchus kaupii]|uniref:Uncharacterized protein n=1 Tax=Synaphobranchus kaupii TaxID=118154 RepID=A0A9Q1E5Z2_SYNKA|nr:hypothetical protein SKAU_G00417790 [Synaphobranchus kaupii]
MLVQSPQLSSSLATLQLFLSGRSYLLYYGYGSRFLWDSASSNRTYLSSATPPSPAEFSRLPTFVIGQLP